MGAAAADWIISDPFGFPGLEFEQQWLNDQGVLSPVKIAGTARPREL